jgi:hypothetical protein
MTGGHALIPWRNRKRCQRRDAPGMAASTATRVAAKGILFARVGIVVALGTLALAGTASAEPVVEPVQEANSPVVEPVQETPAPVEPVVEPVQETPAPVEPVVEPVQETPAPVEPFKEQLQEAVPISDPVPETISPAAPTAEQEGKEGALGTATGQAGEPSPSLGFAPQQEGAAPNDPLAAIAESALIETAPVSATVGAPQERSPSSAAILAILAPVRLTAAQRAEVLSCQLSGLSAPATDNCVSAWPSGTQGSPSAAVSLVAGATTTGAGAPPGGGYGGSVGGSRSAVPPPGPAPTGAFGSSGAGGFGIALSGCFTLAGLLLLAGPRAMLRLRLSCQPWLTAFFVLIPERPG